MSAHIQLKLFATLSAYNPPRPEHYAIVPGTTVARLLKSLGVAQDQAKLIFINGRKGALTSVLQGGERVGIFPPVGGG